MHQFYFLKAQAAYRSKPPWSELGIESGYITGSSKVNTIGNQIGGWGGCSK